MGGSGGGEPPEMEVDGTAWARVREWCLQGLVKRTEPMDTPLPVRPPIDARGGAAAACQFQEEVVEGRSRPNVALTVGVIGWGGGSISLLD